MSRLDPLSSMTDVIERVLARLVARYGSVGERRDLAQDLRLFVLQRGARLVDRFDGRSSLDTYISHVLEKQAISRLRSRIRRTKRTTHLDAVDAPASEQSDVVAGLIDRETRLQRRRAAVRVLAALEPQQRSFLLRCVCGGETMEEIAAALGITRAAAYSRSRRLLARVRDLAQAALPERNGTERNGTERNACGEIRCDSIASWRRATRLA